MSTQSKSVLLSNGAAMPLVGLGTWKSKPGEVGEAVKAAIDAGYRHIDCALAYGNEKEVGEALASRIGSTVQREEIFITTKLWNTLHEPDQVMPAMKKSLADLGLEYVDLYLIHWPMSFENTGSYTDIFPKHPDGRIRYANVPIEDTWRAMEELVKAGLTKAIGLSNFNASQIDRIMSICTVKPVVDQIECHVKLNQARLKDHAAKHNIVLVAFSPLGNGTPELLSDPEITEIAKAHNKSTAQVLIRFHVQRGMPVLPKSVNADRIAANFNVFDFELTNEQMDKLLKMDCNMRYCVPRIEVGGEMVVRDAAHPEFPFNADF